jgi:hypothetical protein
VQRSALESPAACGGLCVGSEESRVGECRRVVRKRLLGAARPRGALGALCAVKLANSAAGKRVGRALVGGRLGCGAGPRG